MSLWDYVITVIHLIHQRCVTNKASTYLEGHYLISFASFINYTRRSFLISFITLCKKPSNHHANLPLEMYSFTL